MTETSYNAGSSGQQAAAYDRWYSQWLTAELDDEVFPYHQAALAVGGEPYKGARVLDIGCGDGRLARQLALRGAHEVVAVELSAVGLSLARRRNADLTDKISFHTGDIESIPEPAASFAVVYCCEVVEHLLDPVAGLSEISRVLEPDGALILTTPNYLSLLGLHRLSVRLRGRTYTEGGQPVNRVTTFPRTARWLRRAGFRIEQMELHGYHLPRRGRQSQEIHPPRVIAPLVRPFAEQSVFLARRAGRSTP